MAKRRRRAKTRKVYVKAKRKGRRRSSGSDFSMKGIFKIAVPAGIYGGVRERISQYSYQFIAPVVGNFAGQHTDEAVMIVANWGIGKFLGPKVPMARAVAKAGIIVEASRVGARLAGGIGGNSGPSVQTLR